MLKKWIVGLLLILVGVSIYFFFVNDNMNQDMKKTELPVLPAEMNDDEQQEQNDEEENENEIENEETESNLGDKLSKGVQKAFDVFQNNEYRITAIGDSLTQGVGDETDGGGFIGILEKELNHGNQKVTFDNYGKRGNRTDQLLSRLKDSDVVESMEEADIILVTIGANDIMQVAKENFTNLTYNVFEKEQVQYEDRLDTILQTIKQANSTAKIYLIGFYNPFQEYFPEIEELNQIVTEWNRSAKNTIEQNGYGTFIPTNDLFENGEVHLFADDHFHPNYSGYKRIAERILPYITEPRG